MPVTSHRVRFNHHGLWIIDVFGKSHIFRNYNVSRDNHTLGDSYIFGDDHNFRLVATELRLNGGCHHEWTHVSSISAVVLLYLFQRGELLVTGTTLVDNCVII